MFDDTKTRILAGPLAPERVRPLTDSRGRPVLRDGKPVHYMEAWDLIEQANLIFGFGNWSRETVSVAPVHDPVMRKHDTDTTKDVMVASFWAKVRITVTDGSCSIVREGCGAATSYQKTVGDAVEMAIKSAETDAMKRALMTFGNQFGLALYDKQLRNVGHENAPQLTQGTERPMARIDVGFADVESGRAPNAESGDHALNHAPKSAPRPSNNSQRALTHMTAPNGRESGQGPNSKHGGGLRY